MIVWWSCAEKTQPSKYYQIWGGNNQIWAKIIDFQDAFKSQPAANKLKLVAFPNQVQNLILKQVLLAGHGNAFPYSESERQLLSTLLDHRSCLRALSGVVHVF